MTSVQPAPIQPVEIDTRVIQGRPPVRTYQWGSSRTSFLGFPDKRPPYLLSDVQAIDGRDPGVLTLQDLVLMPRRQCLYSPQGDRVEVTKTTYIEPDIVATPSFADKVGGYEQSRSPPHEKIPLDLEVYDEPIVLLGRMHAHYGHFLTDTQARIWALLKNRQAWARLKVLFTPVWPHELSIPVVQRFLGLLGIPEERVWTVQRPTLLRQVIVPLPSIQLSRRIYTGFDAPHREVAHQLLRPEHVPDRPVYLSRRGLGERHRAIVGEDRLEAALEREGFRIVRPETLDLQAQVGIFNGRSPIVGVLGSALHNALFRLEAAPQRLGIVTDGGKSPRFHLVDAVKPLHTSYILGMDLSEATPAHETRFQERAYVLNVDQTMDYLSDAGLLR